MRIEMKKKLQQMLIEQQKNEEFHIPLKDEFQFYRCIQRGDTDVLLANISAYPTDGMGKLSDNPLRNSKYHLIILTAMIARFCVEGGLPSETAYTMSDYFIRSIDQASHINMLSDLKREIMEEYVKAMQNLDFNASLSLHTLNAIEYIQKHITSPISVAEIADELQVHPDYLSKLFKQEFGYPLSEYIHVKKCDTAKYMLANSTASCTEIGYFLGYASCSHFITHFKKVTGMTPNTFRQKEQGRPFSTSS